MSKTIKSFLSISAAFLLSISFLLMPVGAADTEATSADIAFTQGSLLINSVPTFDFGTQTISTEDQIYTGTVTDNIAVSDARGSAAGWTLTVSLGIFTQGGGGSNSLKGAEIKITPSAAYTTTGSGTLPGTVAPFVDIISGDTAAKTITVAATGQGAGLMTNVISDSKLTVYGSTALLGAHTAVVDWVLGDTP